MKNLMLEQIAAVTLDPTYWNFHVKWDCSFGLYYQWSIASNQLLVVCGVAQKLVLHIMYQMQK